MPALHNTGPEYIMGWIVHTEFFMNLLFHPLFSGSRGNAAYVEAGDVRLLVDAGVSCARLTAALNGIGRDPARLDGILISHEHNDHTAGLDLFATNTA